MGAENHDALWSLRRRNTPGGLLILVAVAPVQEHGASFEDFTLKGQIRIADEFVAHRDAAKQNVSVWTLVRENRNSRRRNDLRCAQRQARKVQRERTIKSAGLDWRDEDEPAA